MRLEIIDFKSARIVPENDADKAFLQLWAHGQCKIDSYMHINDYVTGINLRFHDMPIAVKERKKLPPLSEEAQKWRVDFHQEWLKVNLRSRAKSIIYNLAGNEDENVLRNVFGDNKGNLLTVYEWALRVLEKPSIAKRRGIGSKILPIVTESLAEYVKNNAPQHEIITTSADAIMAEIHTDNGQVKFEVQEVAASNGMLTLTTNDTRDYLWNLCKVGQTVVINFYNKQQWSKFFKVIISEFGNGKIVIDYGASNN